MLKILSIVLFMLIMQTSNAQQTKIIAHLQQQGVEWITTNHPQQFQNHLKELKSASF